MTIKEKYSKLKDIFFKDFIVATEETTCRGTNIPASKRVKSPNTGLKILYWGDGTINMAEYLHYLLMESLLGDKTCNNKILWCLKSLQRLSTSAYEDEKMKNPKVYFVREKGFLLRDDISSSSCGLFDAIKIESGYSNGIELENEDPCFSPFVSQDQIWNLLPSLSLLIDVFKGQEIGNLAKEILHDILSYVSDHGHTIYNPYFSALKHFWTYLPSMNTEKLKPWDRVEDRNNHLKYTVKVKRGANNWYFAYGFRKTLKKFVPEAKLNGFMTFLYGVWYIPFIFLADRVYSPIVTRFGVKRKDNSYYCMSSAGDVWYAGRKNYLKRVCKKFNEDKEYAFPALAECLKQEKWQYIDIKALEKWLNDYEFDENSLESPVKFLTLSCYLKLIQSLA